MTATIKFDIQAPGDKRLTEMARAQGYVMVRRPGCSPFILQAHDFDALPDWSEADQTRYEEFKARLEELARRPVAE